MSHSLKLWSLMKFVIYMFCNIRVISAMGCSQGCAESQRCTQSDSVRSHAQNLLLRLCQKFNDHFAKFFQTFVEKQNLSTVMEFFHALCGFCQDSTGLLSPLAMPSMANYIISLLRMRVYIWMTFHRSQSSRFLHKLQQWNGKQPA